MGAGSSGRGWPRWNRVGKREEGETDSEEVAYVGDVVVGDAEGRRSGEEDYEISDPLPWFCPSRCQDGRNQSRSKYVLLTARRAQAQFMSLGASDQLPCAIARS